MLKDKMTDHLKSLCIKYPYNGIVTSYQKRIRGIKRLITWVLSNISIERRICVMTVYPSIFGRTMASKKLQSNENNKRKISEIALELEACLASYDIPIINKSHFKYKTFKCSFRLKALTIHKHEACELHPQMGNCTLYSYSCKCIASQFLYLAIIHLTILSVNWQVFCTMV